ncbi:MAG: hypothetical protein JWM02_1021 [Frankiales bacterium]|nr:hypothetical protein [Frankiales bacterium]
MRNTLLVTSTALVVGALTGLAGQASAASTTTTFSVDAGPLGVTAPSNSALGSAAPGSTASASLGSVTVNDTRASITGSWTATVVSSAFTTGTATANETIPATAVKYWSGAATGTTGLGVFTPGQLTSLLAVTIDTAQTAFGRAVAVGNSSATWAPTVTVTIPTTAVSGTYSGTITHSVA